LREKIKGENEMEKTRKWWGWILEENGETIGFIDNQGGSAKWKVVASDNRTIIGEDVRLRKDAIAMVLEHNKKEQEIEMKDSIFGKWVSSNQILEQMTIDEFRTKIFTGEIHIKDMNLGQPRHIKIMGNGLFLLSKGF
jgi:hypothetical protein